MILNLIQTTQFLCRFHHKKGWVQNYAFPEEEILGLDLENLPTLCLPDQSHNFEKDTVYFVLPNQSNEKKVFGKTLLR